MATTVEVQQRISIRTWLGRLLLAALALWIGADLLHTLAYALRTRGLLAGAVEAVFVFRLGEALVILPLAAFLLAAGRDAAFLRRARWLVWVGALLAGISFPGLNGRLIWAPLALLVAALGLLLPWLAGGKRGCVSRLAGWLGLAALLLLHLVGLAAGFLFYGYAAAPYPAAFPRPAATRDERWRQDVRYLGSELSRLHKNAYHTTPGETFKDQIERLETAVPGLSDARMAVELMRITAMVGDAHTLLRRSARLPLHSLPVDLRWYGDGLYVRGVSPEYPGTLGKRVVKIGSLPAEQAYQAILPFISHENESWARLQSSNYLNVTEVLESIGAAVPNSPVELTLEDASGQEFTLEIVPLGHGEQVDFLSAVKQPAYYQSRPEQPFWFEYREKSRSLYLRYAACTDPLGFRSAMRAMWKLADERPVERLMVDLRGNGGGNSFQFEYFFMPGLKAHPQLDRAESLFVLIDRGTFSSASDNAAHLLIHSEATFVGEPTGGKPNSYGEVRQFRLPNSRASVSYSTNYFKLLETDPASIEPDIHVPVTAEAAFAGRDPVLEKIAPEEDW